MERQKSTSGGISVGSSSILVIFVVLALTAFAALSLTTAGSDLRLTQRVARATQEYYVADSKAVEAAAELRRVYEVSRREEFPAKAQALGWTVNGMFANLSVPMQDNTTLEVTADFSKLPIRFTRWQVVNEADWVEQDSFALWGGEEMGLAGAVPSDLGALANGPLPPVPGLNPAVSPAGEPTDNTGVMPSEQGTAGVIGGVDEPTYIQNAEASSGSDDYSVTHVPTANNVDEPTYVQNAEESSGSDDYSVTNIPAVENVDTPTYVQNTEEASGSADYSVTHIPSSEGLQGKE